MTKFTLALAGRPNVGKSTLYNRLIGRQMAIVSDEPGVTRDWREGEGELFDLSFRVLDTAGLEDASDRSSLTARAAGQTRKALEQTDIVMLVVDARAGLSPDDKVIARELRKSGKPIVLVANKCEGTRLPESFDDFTRLGFGEAVALSAAHGEGLHDLYEALCAKLPKQDGPEESEDEQESKRKKAKKKKQQQEEFEDESEMHLHVAIVGRPNAGKSTLLNRLIGEDRMLTGPEPGLTRDSIPVNWEYKGHPIRLVDTAGLRKRARVTGNLEKLSTHETMRSVRLAHVVVLVVDADQPLDKQDLVIAHHVMEEGRALIIAVNKWDAVKDPRAAMKRVEEKIEDSLAQAAGIPVVPISALKGEGLDRMMKEVMRIYEIWNQRVSTGKLNRWLQDMEDNHPPPITAGRRVKLRYITQLKSRPPTFALWVNKPVGLPESYIRFLTHGLRDVFGLEGVPIRWQIKKSANPYEHKKKET
ncbi:MAG: ribosome biogenesis GTPase Der [Bdellovibrionales bacterium]